MKKNPIRHIDIISVIPINSGVRFTTNPVIEMITFKRHPINAHKAAVLNLGHCPKFCVNGNRIQL